MGEFTTIKIDGITISGYSEYYVINHMVKKSEPTRVDNFSLSNINDITQAETAEIFITFKYLDIETYRKLVMIMKKAEFKVEYYDQDYDSDRVGMFYLKQSESLEPFAYGGKWYGVKNWKLDLVATLNNECNTDIKVSDSYGNNDFIRISTSTSATASITTHLYNVDTNANVSGTLTLSLSNEHFKFTSGGSGSSSSYTVSCPTTGVTIVIGLDDLSSTTLTGECFLYITGKVGSGNTLQQFTKSLLIRRF